MRQRKARSRLRATADEGPEADLRMSRGVELC